MTDPAAAALDQEAIIADARRAGDYADWDDGAVREPLEVLLDALASEAKLSDQGRLAAGQRLRNLVTSYAQLQHDSARHPEILEERIENPIVVVGLPRSGTTLLHTLLAADPAHRAPQWWESLRPSPPPEAATYETDPRRAVVQAEFDSMLERSPELFSALAYAADLAAECNTLSQPTLRTQAFCAYYHTPSYQRWYLSTDQAPLYRYHRRVLQQLQWHGPKGRWVLKAPPHIFTMDELVAEYPDATLIHIHRDPKTTIASNASLYHGNRILHSDQADPFVTGRDVLEDWGVGARRIRDFRARRPDLGVIDVTYDELVADPIATTGALYAVMGQVRSPEGTAAVRAALERNARDKRPAHRYTLEEFGLTPKDVEEHFGVYEPKSSLPEG
jgi:hypothetical protein